MIRGYARCSTNELKQDIDRQKRELEKMGAERIYWEYESGTKDDRQQLMALMDDCAAGDTICVIEVSRLTRSTQKLCEIMKFIQDNHLCLTIGSSFSADCRKDEIDPMTKGMIMMWGVFSEMERDIISQRVKSGMQNAKAKGKSIGRPTFSIKDLPKGWKSQYQKYIEGHYSITDLSKHFCTSRSTVYRWIEAWKKESERKGENFPE